MCGHAPRRLQVGAGRGEEELLPVGARGPPRRLPSRARFEHHDGAPGEFLEPPTRAWRLPRARAARTAGRHGGRARTPATK